MFLTSPGNLGYSAGNNIGLRYATQEGYDVAAICNPDMMFPDETCLSKCLKAFGKDPEIVWLAPDIVLPDGHTHHNPQVDGPYDFWSVFLGPFRLFKSILLRRPSPAIGEADWQTSRYCKRLSGCFFLIRVSFLQKIGFLDENVFLYGEEAVLASQVRREGKKAYYLADTHALHNHDYTARKNPCRSIRIMQKSELYIFQNYCGFSRWQYLWILLSRIPGNLVHNFLLWLKYHGTP